MRTPSLDKVAFVLSVAVFAFLYGIATQAFGWPPSAFLQRAWNQAEAAASAGWLPGRDANRLYGREPRVYRQPPGTRIEDPGAIQPGLTLIATSWKEFGWDKGLKLIDQEGKVVHRWRIPGDEVFPDPPDEYVKTDPAKASVHGVYLFPGGDVLVNIEYVGTARIDACGEVLWRLPSASHHSIARAENGTFWVSAGTYTAPQVTTRPSGGFPGTAPTYWDRILHVSEHGEILDEIRILDVLYRNDLQRHIPKGSSYPPRQIGKYSDDLTHLNDVEPLPSSIASTYPGLEAGDLLVSLNHLDLIFVLDPQSKRVKWHASEPFIQQHDPDFLGDGWIGVFDNNRDGTDRGEMLGGSRIVALQPHTDSMKVLFPTQKSEQFYTEVYGKWQRLENGNLLLTEGVAGRVAEVAPDGRTVWEWVAEPYKEESVPEVSEGIRYDLTEQQVAAWPCSPGASIAREEGSRP